MTREEIFSKVVDTIAPFAKNQDALEDVSEETNILGELQVNSARLVDVILDLEVEFDVEVEDEDADAVNTVGDAVDLIVAKTSRSRSETAS